MCVSVCVNVSWHRGAPNVQPKKGNNKKRGSQRREGKEEGVNETIGCEKQRGRGMV